MFVLDAPLKVVRDVEYTLHLTTREAALTRAFRVGLLVLDPYARGTNNFAVRLFAGCRGPYHGHTPALFVMASPLLISLSAPCAALTQAPGYDYTFKTVMADAPPEVELREQFPNDGTTEQGPAAVRCLSTCRPHPAAVTFVH
jgi:hypothetical protein